MSGRNEELLSAYFDGELTDDEKSLVEQLLADDIATRDMLDDVGEVSGWVRSLPRPAAPADLRHQVLLRVRETRPVHVAAPVPRPQRRSQIRWIVATAAGLLAVVALYRTWPVLDQRQDAVALGTNSSGFEQDEELGRGWAMTAAVAEDPTTVAFTNSGQMLDELARSLESGATPVPGEVVHDVAQFGDQVLIIPYRVVDTQDLPGQVQVILTQNGIATIGNGPEAGETVADFDADQNGQFEAIYLDAPVSNFNSAVAQITDLDQVTSVMTNNLSFTVAATEGVPEAAEAEGFQLEQLTQPPAAESEAPASLPEARYAGDLKDTVSESIADDSGNQPAAAAAPLPLGVPDSESLGANGVAGISDLSLSADQPQSGEKSLDLYEAVPAADGIAAQQGGEPAVQNYAAFQVPVPVPESLRFKLQESEELLTEGEADGRLSELAAPQRSPSQSGRQFWNYSPRPQQGPPAPNRIRVVILLVPDKSE